MFIELLTAGLTLSTIGFIFGILLGFASKVFMSNENNVSEQQLAIRAALPGVNCGACGYQGCDAFAKAVWEGMAQVDGCPVGRAATAKKIAEIMGQ